LALLLSFAAALLYAPSAWAAPMTFEVDNGADATGQSCTALGVGDCSLRSAIEHSNSNSGTDTITFEPGEFNGSLTSTISTTNDIVISDPVDITGGNCGTTAAPKPCVRLDRGGGSIGLNVNSAGVSINGIAFTQAQSAIQDNGFSGLSLTGSWFGVEIDGTTLAANDSGVTFNNASGGTIGGSTALTRNVFADNNNEAINIAGSGGGQVIKGNYLGTLPDGSAVADPGAVGILMQGSNSGATIGGDATTPEACDGECNLIDNFAQDGIRNTFAGASPSGFTISGNFIGLGLDGTSNRGNGTSVDGGSGIDLDQSSDNVTIGGTATKRNYIAGNSDRGITAVSSTNLHVINNYIGLTADGSVALPNSAVLPSFTGTGIRSVGGSGGTYADNRLGGNGMTVDASNTVTGNVIGIGAGGEDVGVTGEPGLNLIGDSNTVGGQDPGDGNTIGNMKTATPNGALVLSGSSTNTIQGNFIGTTSTGVAEPNAATGILVGGTNQLLAGNTIGGPSPDGENVISNNGTDAIAQPVPNGPTQFQENVGKNNGTTANDLFIDLGPDGPGNSTGGSPPNDGIQAPTISNATSTLASGTGDEGDSIFVYATYTGRGDIRKALGSTVVTGGAWSAVLPSLPAGACVTANQSDTSNNYSEMANPVAVGGGACVTQPGSSIDSGPNNATTNDNTPTFGFSSSETGVTFECKVDASSFSACPDGDTFTPSSPLADGSHTFQERAVQNGGNPALSPELGAANSRTFTVDTTGPVVTFTSGPANGSRIGTASPMFGFSANEQPSTFECKVDAGSFSACSSPFTASSLAEGAHTVQVRGTDGVGNVGASVSRTFTVDTTGPTVTFNAGPANGSTIDTGSATFGFSANEPSTFACRVDAGSFSACHSPFTASSLAAGAHTVQVRGTDSVGNVGASVTRSFTVQLPVPTTGQRAKALKKCKKQHKKKKSAKAFKKCKRKANKLPV
jgi:hypothetical protein